MGIASFSFSTDVQAVNDSHFGKPGKPIHLSNVFCSGREQQILSCMHTEISSLDEKKEAMNETNVAGVICGSTTSRPIPTIAPTYPNSNNNKESYNNNNNENNNNENNNNNNDNDGNNAPGDPTVVVMSGDQTTEGSLAQSLVTTIPNYLIALALFLGILLAIV